MQFSDRGQKKLEEYFHDKNQPSKIFLQALEALPQSQVKYLQDVNTNRLC